MEHSLYKIQVEQGTPESIELRLLGANDPRCNTMLAIEDNGERINLVRPEPAMVDAIEQIAEDEMFIVDGRDRAISVVGLDDDEVERFERMVEQLKDALNDSRIQR